MKLGPAVIGIILAGGLGYLLEPALRPALVAPPKEAAAQEEKASSPAPPEPAQPVVPSVPVAPAWVASLTPEQLPSAVTLNSQASLSVAGASAPVLVPAGVQVKPVRVEGTDLVVNFAGTAEGKVAVMSTDLVQLLGNKAPEAPIVPPVVVVEPSSPVVQEPIAPAPPIEPEPVAPPAPPEGQQLSPEEIVAVMQASVKGGEIKEFGFDQVLGWKADEVKESGGETYQTGLASYKAETIFGVKNIQAQALIKDGKVEKWIWPKSGMEIK